MSESSVNDACTEPAVLDFNNFGLHPEILKAIEKQGYTVPTPIQAQTIPLVLAGRDVLGAAQTGTGKTASFSLPIIQRLLPFANTSMSPARHAVRALVLTPTRELADQVAANVHAYAQYTPLRSVAIFGGVDIGAQAEKLRLGAEILIATPGRLLDHLQQKNTQLSQVQMLVLDEADRMLDMGFLPALQRILNLLPSTRQTLLFSATFSNEITKLANSYLREPVKIEIAQRNATATNVSQRVYKVADADKPAAVMQLIQTYDLQQVIVFCNSKIGAGRLTRQLEKEGLSAVAIHGDKSQLERMNALEQFKNKAIKVLVATDIAARGLDIAELPAVINFDLPFSPEDYVHRIGRTGRAGASGAALSLCSPNEYKQLADIEKLIGRPLDQEILVINSPRAVPYSSASRSRSNSASSHSSGRSAAHSSRTRVAPLPVDDFFTKPYEPSPTTANAAEANRQTSQQSTMGSLLRTSKKRPLAALLGGGVARSQASEE